MTEIYEYTPNAEELIHEGDYYIRQISLTAYNGKTYDITLLRTKLMIYEDIFCSYIGGEITLQDAVDLPHLLPLIGEEKIKIVFTRPDVPGKSKTKADVLLEDIVVEFRVYKMDDRQNIKDRHQIYTLYFVSEDYLKNFKTRVMKSYIDMPYSDMVYEIFKKKLKTKKDLNIEPSKYRHKMAITNISPLAAINMLAGRSESDEGNGCLYLCFEDRTHYNYCSIGKLFEQKPAETYTYGIKNVRKSNLERAIEQDLVSMEQYAFSGSFDILKGLSKGLYGSRLITYDLVRGIHKTVDFDYNEEFDSFKHLDRNKPFTSKLDVLSAPQAHIKFVHTNKGHDKVPWIVEREPGILPNRVEEWLLYRQSQMQQIDGAKIACSLPGDPRRKAGQLIEFLLPHQQGNFDEEHSGEPYDDFLTGKYLITAITHRLEADSYFMDIEIIKDTFANKIRHKSPIDEYSWTW